MSSEVPGLLATTNLEGKVSIYDTQVIHENGAVDLIASANPKFVLIQIYCRINYTAGSFHRIIRGLSAAVLRWVKYLFGT
jgi:hypothetical protein